MHSKKLLLFKRMLIFFEVRPGNWLTVQVSVKRLSWNILPAEEWESPSERNKPPKMSSVACDHVNIWTVLHSEGCSVFFLQLVCWMTFIYWFTEKVMFFCGMKFPFPAPRSRTLILSGLWMDFESKANIFRRMASPSWSTLHYLWLFSTGILIQEIILALN